MSGDTGSITKPSILFTAFEPSGDDHAAGVIAELKRRHPDLPILAWGGSKMERAGATLVGRTGDDAVMGLPGLAKIREHHRINQQIESWLDHNPVTLHVPVDSPAANFPICAITKARGIRVVHLVAPQIWAWGRWRIHKLRRSTDLVLCLLPFEEQFFTKRDVPARFIGHPLFDAPINPDLVDVRTRLMGDGAPRIAMMPGSRPNELERHLALVLDAFRLIKAAHPGASGVVAAASDHVANWLHRQAQALGGWPDGVRVVTADTDAVVRWCDIALVKSGTVTLQVAKQGRPMVIFYRKSNPLFFLMARAVMATRLFSLPNVIAGKRIVPEFVPHWGGPQPIADEALRLLADPAVAQRQRDDLADIVSRFKGLHFSSAAADAIESLAGLRPHSAPAAPAGPRLAPVS